MFAFAFPMALDGQTKWAYCAFSAPSNERTCECVRSGYSLLFQIRARTHTRKSDSHTKCKCSCRHRHTHMRACSAPEEASLRPQRRDLHRTSLPSNNSPYFLSHALRAAFHFARTERIFGRFLPFPRPSVCRYALMLSFRLRTHVAHAAEALRLLFILLLLWTLRSLARSLLLHPNEAERSTLSAQK